MWLLNLFFPLVVFINYFNDNNAFLSCTGDTKNKGVVKAVEKPVKQKKKRETTTKDAGRSKRKRRPKKRSESDGNCAKMVSLLPCGVARIIQ